MFYKEWTRENGPWEFYALRASAKDAEVDANSDASYSKQSQREHTEPEVDQW